MCWVFISKANVLSIKSKDEKKTVGGLSHERNLKQFYQKNVNQQPWTWTKQASMCIGDLEICGAYNYVPPKNG